MNLDPAAVHIDEGARFAQQGRLAEAEASFRRAVLASPKNVDAHNNLATALAVQGRLAEAIHVYEHALRLNPNDADSHFNRGSALRVQGQLEPAATSYLKVLELQPHHANALVGLGHVRRAQGHITQAMDHYRESLRWNPNLATAHLCLGDLLADQQKLDEAEGCFREACRLRPADVKPYIQAASVLATHGWLQQANGFIRRALELAPNDPTVRYLHSAITGRDLPQTAPREYVVSLFDRHAAHFDDHLMKTLEYRGPQLLRAVVPDLSATHSLDILDLGCGTGLSGAAFQDLARTLTGVDLSAGMLAQAQARGIYHKLVHGELLEYLQASLPAFDLILAADVFIYVGELFDVFSVVPQALRPGGRFVLVVEAHEGPGYVLRASQRFAHSLEYIRELARRNGLTETAMRKSLLRREGDCEIDAYALALSLP